MNEFEELARRSADAVHESVSRIATPELGHRPNRRPIVVGGLVLSAVVLLAGVLAWQGRDTSTPAEVEGIDFADDGPTAGEGAEGESFHLEWPAPEGFELFYAGDQPAVEEFEDQMATTQVFGRGTAEDPFADGDLMIVTFFDERDESGASDFSGEEVEVRGTTGWLDPTLADLGFAYTVGWHEADDVSAAVVSRSMSVDELLEVVESLEFAGHVVTAEPPGLERVIDVEGLPFGGPAGGASGWVVGYGPSSAGFGPGDNRSVTLTASQGQSPDVPLQRYFFGLVAAPTIRGGEAWMAASDVSRDRFLGGPQLMWSERGFVVSLTVSDGLDPFEIAESLVSVDDERWAEMIAAVEDFGEIYEENIGIDPIDESELLAEGSFEVDVDFVEWRLALDASLNLCMSIRGERGEQDSCTDSNLSRLVWGSCRLPRRAGSRFGGRWPMMSVR